ncbi:uncharacterized protein PG998_002902 [Apiospora kogelbergensis]|uniref:Uncharacterized protein n=1 Tax=Apiospora kogelbergensis TaxID=1337665 RepID=A0AAW0Q9L6_9PEZI
MSSVGRTRLHPREEATKGGLMCGAKIGKHKADEDGVGRAGIQGISDAVLENINAHSHHEDLNTGPFELDDGVMYEAEVTKGVHILDCVLSSHWETSCEVEGGHVASRQVIEYQIAQLCRLEYSIRWRWCRHGVIDIDVAGIVHVD